MRMILYKIVNRELVEPKAIEVPNGTVDFDSWLHSQDYGKEYTLRRGIVQEMTDAERKAFQREHDRLKAVGKIPSAATAMIAKLSEKYR